MARQPEPIRDAIPSDVDAIKAIAVASGLLATDEVGMLDEMLNGFFDGTMEGHRWIVQEQTPAAGITAAAYYAPEPFADRMWNLYFIAVAPHVQGRGTGGRLLQVVEAQLKSLGEAQARTLIVETSSTPKFERTREFYRKHGFTEEATIRQFYGPNDHKVVFWKQLADSPPG